MNREEIERKNNQFRKEQMAEFRETICELHETIRELQSQHTACAELTKEMMRKAFEAGIRMLNEFKNGTRKEYPAFEDFLEQEFKTKE